MKKILIISISIISISNLFSCRKGEHDPFISLMSRKARLCGEWKVTYEEYKTTHYSNGYGPLAWSQTNEDIYDGAIKTGFESGSGTYYGPPDSLGNQWYSYKYSNMPDSIEYYSEEYTFKKDNSFLFKHLNNDGSSISYDGNWLFSKKDEDEHTKNKGNIQLIVLNYCKTDKNGSNITSIPSNFVTEISLYIDRLKNNEIILINIVNTGSGLVGGFNDSWGNYKRTITTLKKKK